MVTFHFTCVLTTSIYYTHVKIDLRFLKKEGYFGIISKAKLFAVRERPRCSSRTTALPFAKGSAALREQQIKTTSRNRETDVKITLKRCLNNLCFNSLSSRKYLILTQISRISRRALATLVLAIRLITLGKAVSCEPLAMQLS